MVIIKHARATFRVKPEHAQSTHDLLALIDKTKGKRGAKLARDKGNPKHYSSKRYFPAFEPGMSTGKYLRQYAVLNAHVHLVPCTIEPAVNRTPPELDPTIPEVVEELCEQ